MREGSGLSGKGSYLLEGISTCVQERVKVPLVCLCRERFKAHWPECKESLKGQCHEIFCFSFFSWISFPPAPEYPIRTVSNFFENSRRYSQVKVHHRYQRHRWQICHRCQRYRRQILPPVLLVLLICRRYQRHRQQFATGINDTAANLPPVSMTPVANFGNNIRLLRP